jgi:ABC-type Fe3+/spermidine/putrescine transport system ATPase subunit
MAEIKLESVTVRDKGKIVLDNVSLTIESGEYVALLGPTGSGPSHLLEVIAGLLPVDSGTVYINNKDVTLMPPEDRKIGFVFEQFNLFPHLSVLDNLLYGPRMRDEDLEVKTRIAREIIGMVRLDGRENALTKELSGGMQQRVGVARAITAGAEILLLDQPYRALDAKIREEMRSEIRDLVKELGLTALHATHEKEEAMITADRIAVFSDGKLLQIDAPQEIFNNPTSNFVAQFLANSNQYTGQFVDGIFQADGIQFQLEKSNPDLRQILIREQDISISIKPLEGVNVFEGTIVKTRLLGEFIRFTIQISSITMVCRELLSLNHKNFREMLNRPIWIKIQPQDIIQLE